jgi:hypothetical protein
MKAVEISNIVVKNPMAFSAKCNRMVPTPITSATWTITMVAEGQK